MVKLFGKEGNVYSILSVLDLMMRLIMRGIIAALARTSLWCGA